MACWGYVGHVVCMGCLIQGSLVYVFVAFSSSQMSWVVDIYGVTSFIPVFYTLLVTTGVIRYGFVLRVTQGHWYMWRTPLLAPVSTVGKTRLLVVAVQGAPPILLSAYASPYFGLMSFTLSCLALVCMAPFFCHLQMACISVPSTRELTRGLFNLTSTYFSAAVSS